MRLRIISPAGETSERVVETARARLGRDPACEVAFDAATYPKVSSEHAHIERTASGLVLTPRSQSNKTLLNDRPLDGPAALKVGDRIRLGFTGPMVEILDVGDEGQAARGERREARGEEQAARPSPVIPHPS